ncbi:MAG: transglutaminase TgpA family protein, partial [Candidatus Entotheonellia bacterium]
LFLLFFILDLLYLAPSFMEGMVHLLVFVLVYKLFNRQETRDYRDLYLLSFFQLVAASAFTVSVSFLVAFLLFLLLGTWTLILFHLRKEAEACSAKAALSTLHAPLLSAPFLVSTLAAALAAFLVTAALFLIFPRLGRAYLPLSWQSGSIVSGFSKKVELGAVGSIQSDPTVVMRVELPDLTDAEVLRLNLKWRGIALDRFDGRSWSTSPTSNRVIMKQPEGMFQVQRVEGEPVLRQQISLEPIGTEALFSAPNAVAIAVSASALLVDELGSISLSSPPPTRISYLAVSALREDRGEFLSARAWRASIHLPHLPPRIHLLANSLVQDATGPYEKAKRIEAFLRTQYRYSLDVPRNQALHPLEDFLFETRAGHCEYFAASMAVLLRMVGVPSRVVNGFQRGEWNEFGRYFTIRQQDAHSWVEAYVHGRGWMTFDPSPRGTVAVEGSRTLGLLVRYVDALRMRWNRYVVGYNLGDQILMALALKQSAETIGEGLGRGFARLTDQLRALRESLPSMRVLLALAAGALLALIFLVVVRHRSHEPARPEGSRIVFYEQALKLLAKRGFSKAPHLTPREFAQGLRSQAQDLPPIEELFTLYYRVRFGGTPLSSAEENHVKRLLAHLADRSPPSFPAAVNDAAPGSHG